MKRVLSLAIVFLMLCSLLVVPIYAVGSGSLSMTSESGNRGDTVTLSVDLESNPGLVTMTIRVSYDTSVLQLTDVSNPGLLVGAQLNTNYGSPYTISWVDGATTTNNTQTGTIATFTFKILDSAAIGDSEVVLQFVDSYDTDYNENSFSATSGIVTVSCQHTYGDWVDAGNGKHSRSCSICFGEEETADHTWNSGSVTTQPTCKEEGEKTFTCTACAATKVESIAKTNNHQYGGWTKVNDTTHKHTCSVCSKEETANHTWDSGSVTTQPTCKEEGEKTFACTACDATKVESIAKSTNHQYGSWIKVNDTTHKHTCSVCSKEETADHTWNSGSVTTPPTCKEEGEKTFTCTGCDATKVESVAKSTNHQYGSWTKVNDTTHKHTCSVCSKEETADHTWNSGSVTTPPTCIEEGEKTFTCTECDATKVESVAKSTNHQYGGWSKVNDTMHTRTCSVCSEEETVSHAWDNGKVTEQPTCKEEGVKTFTCTGCDATKTESVAKTTDHKYGSWNKVNDTTHKHVCSLCSKEETANHTWNSGSVITQPTCKEEGVKKYTCTVCNATKTEPIPKLTAHTYDNACDAECNVCEAVRTVAHKYETTWSTDKTSHWHECTVCKAKQDVAAHIPGEEATETKPQTCTVCNYVLKAALDHEHSYATTWTTDENDHWHACSGCEEKDGCAAHDFENSCDKDCSICGYIRVTEHKFSATWASDANSHWRVCSECGLKQDEAAHEPGAEATVTTAQTCTICGYEISPVLEVVETEASTGSNDSAETTSPADVTDPTDSSLSLPIVIVAVIVVVGAVGAFIVIKKKK